MALEIKGLQRVFKIRKDSSEIELADPDNSFIFWFRLDADPRTR